MGRPIRTLCGGQNRRGHYITWIFKSRHCRSVDRRCPQSARSRRLRIRGWRETSADAKSVEKLVGPRLLDTTSRICCPKVRGNELASLQAHGDLTSDLPPRAKRPCLVYKLVEDFARERFHENSPVTWQHLGSYPGPSAAETSRQIQLCHQPRGRGQGCARTKDWISMVADFARRIRRKEDCLVIQSSGSIS